LGIVVKNLENTIKIYLEEYGISKWQKYESAENYYDCRSFEFLIARCKIGDVFLELIEPDKNDEKSIYGKFLKLKGEGLHNVGYFPYNFKQAQKIMEKKILSRGHFNSKGTNKNENRNLPEYLNEYSCFDYTYELKHVIKIYKNLNF
jgi:hypothetical protein